MRRKRSSHRTREQWQQIVEEQAQSGLSQKAFCEQRGIVLSSFHNAKARLGATSLVAGPAADFIGVTIEDFGAPTANAGWDVKLCLGAGVVLRLRRNGAR